MASLNNLKVTIGGPEGTPGSAETLTHVVPIRGNVGMRSTLTKAPDPVISGVNMIRSKYALAGDVAGSLDLSMRGSAGVGKLLNSLLGQEVTPVQIGAAIRIRYTGSGASCKISADTSADTLTSETGVKGAETGDVNFGTAGDISLVAAATDTVGELVTVINAYADYEAEKIFGADSASAANIVSVTAKQAKNGWVTLWFTSAITSIYLHQWIVNLTNTERPVYTMQVDGRQDNYLYTGCVVNNMSLTAALKGFVEATADILGFGETGGQAAQSALDLEAVEPFRFHNYSLSIAAADYTFVRRMSLNIQNNHNPEGYGGGSLFRQYHEKARFAATGEWQIRLDATSILEKPKVEAGTLVNSYLMFEGGTIETNFPELMLIEMPYCSIDDFDWPENNGVLDAKIPFEVVKGLDSPYNDPLTVSMLTEDSAAY